MVINNMKHKILNPKYETSTKFEIQNSKGLEFGICDFGFVSDLGFRI